MSHIKIIPLLNTGENEQQDIIDGLTLDIYDQFSLLADTVLGLAYEGRKKAPPFGFNRFNNSLLRFSIDVDPLFYPIVTVKRNVGWIDRLGIFQKALFASDFTPEQLSGAYLVLPKEHRAAYERDPCNDRYFTRYSTLPHRSDPNLDEVFDIRLQLTVPIEPQTTHRMEDAICSSTVFMLQATPCNSIDHINRTLAYFFDPVRTAMKKAVLTNTPFCKAG